MDVVVAIVVVVIVIVWRMRMSVAFACFDFHSEFDGGEARAFRFSAIAAQQIIIKILVMVVAVV